jgi:GAF domain-containing protein
MTAPSIRFFSPPSRPDNETARQETVDSYRLVDAATDSELQQLVDAAADLFGAPTAAISIIDHDRQWLIVRKGLDLPETPRAISFCGHAILNPDEVLTVVDPEADNRFQGNPLVKGDDGIRFYVGAPLVAEDGVLGALCVIDNRHNQADERQTAELQRLAAKVIEVLNARYR